MANNKEPKTVSEILDRIDELKEEVKKNNEVIARLQSRLRVHDEKPVPPDFDYKEAVLSAFLEKPTAAMKLDAVEQFITRKYAFTPDKNKIFNRISYLVDRDKRLERVEEKGRGFYRLVASLQNLNASNPKTS